MSEVAESLSPDVFELGRQAVSARLARNRAEREYKDLLAKEIEINEQLFDAMEAQDCSSFRLEGGVQVVRSSMQYSKVEDPVAAREALYDLDKSLYAEKLDTNRLHVLVRKLLKAKQPLPAGVTFTVKKIISPKGLKGIDDGGSDE